MGWRGSLGDSGSLSLYGGIRSRRDVNPGSSSGVSLYPLDPSDTHTIDGVIFVSGTYPATGSISFVKVRNSPIPNTPGASGLITKMDWYDEHYRSIGLLYDYYGQTNAAYFTGSYDYYSLRFKQSVSSLARAVVFPGASLATVTSSFTVEARIMPMTVTGSSEFVIASQQDRWRLFLTGSTGNLAFSDYATTVTASAPQAGVWQHVAVAVGANSASFYLDGSLVVDRPFTGSLLTSRTGSLVVGAAVVISGLSEVYDRGFDGFLYETRVWGKKLSSAQVSSSFDRTLISSSGSSDLKHYARFNDGPLGSAHGFAQGSGTYDHSSAHVHGKMENFAAALPVASSWHKNDDEDFFTLKTVSHGSYDVFRAVHLPSLFYGRQVATGSVRMICRSYHDQGIERVVLDDGRGSLYISGSIARPVSGDDRRGVAWNKVGNVFYSEGLFVITEPSMLDFGDPGLDSGAVTGTLSVEYAGETRIPSRIMMCRLGPAEGNASSNPTFSTLDQRGTEDPLDDRYVVNGDGTTWITSVGLYDDEHRLVAVAKMAQPLRKREKDRLDIRLRFDF